MLTLIMWHNRFSKNENEAVETHIPWHLDSKTKKPQHLDHKTRKTRHQGLGTKTPRNSDPYPPDSFLSSLCSHMYMRHF